MIDQFNYLKDTQSFIKPKRKRTFVKPVQQPLQQLKQVVIPGKSPYQPPAFFQPQPQEQKQEQQMQIPIPQFKFTPGIEDVGEFEGKDAWNIGGVGISKSLYPTKEKALDFYKTTIMPMSPHLAQYWENVKAPPAPPQEVEVEYPDIPLPPLPTYQDIMGGYQFESGYGRIYTPEEIETMRFRAEKTPEQQKQFNVLQGITSTLQNVLPTLSSKVITEISKMREAHARGLPYSARKVRPHSEIPIRFKTGKEVQEWYKKHGANNPYKMLDLLNKEKEIVEHWFKAKEQMNILRNAIEGELRRRDERIARGQDVSDIDYNVNQVLIPRFRALADSLIVMGTSMKTEEEMRQRLNLILSEIDRVRHMIDVDEGRKEPGQWVQPIPPMPSNPVGATTGMPGYGGGLTDPTTGAVHYPGSESYDYIYFSHYAPEPKIEAYERKMVNPGSGYIAPSIPSPITPPLTARRIDRTTIQIPQFQTAINIPALPPIPEAEGAGRITVGRVPEIRIPTLRPMEEIERETLLTVPMRDIPLSPEQQDIIRRLKEEYSPEAITRQYKQLWEQYKPDLEQMEKEEQEKLKQYLAQIGGLEGTGERAMVKLIMDQGKRASQLKAQLLTAAREQGLKGMEGLLDRLERIRETQQQTEIARVNQQQEAFMQRFNVYSQLALRTAELQNQRDLQEFEARFKGKLTEAEYNQRMAELQAQLDSQRRELNLRLNYEREQAMRLFEQQKILSIMQLQHASNQQINEILANIALKQAEMDYNNRLAEIQQHYNLTRDWNSYLYQKALLDQQYANEVNRLNQALYADREKTQQLYEHQWRMAQEAMRFQAMVADAAAKNQSVYQALQSMAVVRY